MKIIKEISKTILQNIVLPLIYVFLKPFNKYQDNLIVFADTSTNKLPLDFLLLKNELAKSYEIKECYLDFTSTSKLAKLKEVIKFLKLLNQAKFVILRNYYLPASSPYLKKKKVIQLWHGCGAFKKFGFDSEDDISKFYLANPCRNYGLVTVSSNYCRKPFAQALNVPLKYVQDLGVSRTDLLFDQDFIQNAKSKFYQEHPMAKNKKIVLWAPTFRGTAANGEIPNLSDFNQLDQDKAKDVYLIVQLHPKIDRNRYIFNLNTSKLSIMELITVCDVLISDYSSVIFEFALLNKPIILYVPDYEDYIKQRGFYLDFQKDLPFYQISSYNKLLELVNMTNYIYNYNEFINFYMKACDTQATKKIINYLKENF